MTLREYQALARRTQNFELTNEKRMLHALHGISAETGEIHAMYQKLYQGHEFDVDVMALEIGDLMWFIAELCDALGIDTLRACAPESLILNYNAEVRPGQHVRLRLVRQGAAYQLSGYHGDKLAFEIGGKLMERK